MAKVVASFTFRVRMEVKDRNDQAEIARTGRKGIRGLLESDSIQDNITEVVDIMEDSVIDEVSDDLEEDNSDYSDKTPVCSECFSENIRRAMIPDNVGNGLHYGWVCDDCKEEDFEPDWEDK